MYLREGKLGILNIWRNIWKHSKVFTFKYPRKSDNHKYLTFLAKIGTPGSGTFRNMTKQKWPKMDQKGCLPTMGVVGDILPFPYRGEWRRLRVQIQSTSGSQTITKLSWSSGWPWPIGFICYDNNAMMLVIRNLPVGRPFVITWFRLLCSFHTHKYHQYDREGAGLGLAYSRSRVIQWWWFR